MKLAEALILRADHQRRIQRLRMRLMQNAKVQEGDPPAEDPTALLAELESVSRELLDLIRRINRTNAATALGQGTIADAIAERDVRGVRHKMLRELAETAVVTQDRYSRSEVKFRSTVDIAVIQREADELARQNRELDAQIQESNWQTELVD